MVLVISEMNTGMCEVLISDRFDLSKFGHGVNRILKEYKFNTWSETIRSRDKRFIFSNFVRPVQ